MTSASFGGWCKKQLEIKFCHNSPRGCGPGRKNSQASVVAGLGAGAPLFVQVPLVVKEATRQGERATHSEGHDLICVGAVAIVQLLLDVRLVGRGRGIRGLAGSVAPRGR